MQQIPQGSGSLLTDKAETIPRSSGRISLLFPTILILKTPTDPSSLKFGEITVLIHFEGKNPTARTVISTPRSKLESTLIQEADGTIIQVILQVSSLARRICLAYLQCISWVITPALTFPANKVIKSSKDSSPKRKQVDTKKPVCFRAFSGFAGFGSHVRSAERSRQPFWLAVNKCWACVLLFMGIVGSFKP